jgi:hypothetical protein
MQRKLADLRDARVVALASASEQAQIGSTIETIFPWSITFDDEAVLSLASLVPRDRALWAAAIQQLSGASLVGDLGESVKASEDQHLSKGYGGHEPTSPSGRDSFLKHTAVTYADNSHYAGGLVNNCWEGYGRLKLSTGETYEGSFKQGMRHGKGTLRLVSGNTYRGNFEAGRRHGYGVFYEAVGGGADTRTNRLNTTHERARAEDGGSLPGAGAGKGGGERLEGLAPVHLELAWLFPKTLKAMQGDKYARMDSYDGEWQADLRHGTGLLTEAASAQRIKYHVEYHKGELKVKKAFGQSESLPHGLAYAEAELVVSVGTAIERNTCHVEGEKPFYFSVDPPLPPGLHLDPATGDISGTPTSELQAMTCTVACHNDASRRAGREPAVTSLRVTVLLEAEVFGWHNR